MKAGTAIVLVSVTALVALVGYVVVAGRVNPYGGPSCAIQDALFRKVMEKARAGGLPETLAGLIEDDWQRLTCAQRAVKLADLIANGVGK